MMKKIVRFLCLIMILAMALSVVSCDVDDVVTSPNGSQNNAGSNSDNSGGSGNSGNSGGSDEGNADEAEQARTEQIAKLKSYPIALLGDSEEKRRDPLKSFEAFSDDFTLIFDSATGSMSNNIKRIWSKDGFDVVEYKDGTASYSVLYNGYLFYVDYDATAASCSGYEELGEYEIAVPVLEHFAIDISDIYSPDDDDDNSERPVLTEDMITVSDDLKSCTLSDEYLKKMAAWTVSSMEAEDADIAAYLGGLEVSGVYTLEDSKLAISIKGTLKNYGELVFDINYWGTKETGYNTSVKFSCVIETEGMIMPVSQELSAKNVKYDSDGNIAYADIELVYLMEDGKGKIMGYDMTVNASEVSVFCIDLSDKNAPKLSGGISKSTVTSVMNMTVSEITEEEFSFNFGGVGAGGSYSYQGIDSDGEIAFSMNFSDAKFGTPSDATIPEAVTVAVEQEYQKIQAVG